MSGGKSLRRAVERFCGDVDERTREEFFSRMEEEYFSLCTPEEIAAHLTMSSRLDSGHPVQLRIVPRRGRIFDIAIVAFDYFSEFSTLCGLVACFGLDIQSGHVYTFSGPSKGNRSRKKIVDLFRCRLLKGEVFSASRQKEFEKELQELISLLDRGELQEVRERVNLRLIEHLARVKELFGGVLYPVEIRFNNGLSEKWTVLDIHSKDTPAFLYALSNALSMRRIYIYKVKIESVGSEVRDRLYICNVEGEKIEGKSEQEALKMAVVLIKQFTHFLPWAPDPAKAIRYFDQLLDKLIKDGAARAPVSFLGRGEILDALARLLGTSDFLWEDFFRMQLENLLPILQDFTKIELIRNKEQMEEDLGLDLDRAHTLEEQKKILNDYKDREMFRIDMRHLVAPGEGLMGFSRALTDLAEAVLGAAYRVCHEHLSKRYGRPLLGDRSPCPFSICGLGKFGGREMGYASDIELLCVYGGPGKTQGENPVDNGEYFDRLCQEMINLIEARREGIFHLDLRLRPYGKDGPLACPLEQMRSYYSLKGGAAPFERQALTKLRWVAGDESLGRLMEAHRDHFVYSGEPWDLKTALHLRRRQIRELVKPGAVNVKYSPGGVIDIEYAVQYLQIMHGRKHPTLRTPSTLEGLESMCTLRIISREEREHLCEAYLFLRALIDALRIVRGNARDLVLPEHTSEEFTFLARRLGYWEQDWAKGAKKLGRDIRFHMRNAHRFFTSHFWGV